MISVPIVQIPVLVDNFEVFLGGNILTRDCREFLTFLYANFHASTQMNTSEQVKWRTELLLKLLPFKYRRRPHHASETTTTLKSARQQLRWQPITTITIGGGAEMEGVTTHSFRKNHDNWMDIMLVRQLMLDQPFSVTNCI
jgi:hypothetical protein